MCNYHNGFFFFKHRGQEGGDRNKPFKSSLPEAIKDTSIEQIRQWLVQLLSTTVVLSV